MRTTVLSAPDAGAFVGGVEVGGIGLGPFRRHRALEQRDAPDVAEARDRGAPGEAMRDLHHCPLGIAVKQDIGFGVGQDRTPHLVGPVVVMGDAAQRTFNAAEHDRHVAECLAAALRIDDYRPVGAPAALAMGCVAVVMAQTAVGRVAVDHGIHVAAGDAEEQGRPSERRERLGAVPVRLGDDADPESLRFQEAPDDGHAETRVVHIGVAGDQHDVAGVPAEQVHLLARHRQERRGAEPVRPVLPIGEQCLGGIHAGTFTAPGRFVALKRRESGRPAPLG